MEKELDRETQADQAAALAAALAPIEKQNLLLTSRARKKSFDPASELDYSANGAARYIYDFYETVARFEEGEVPYETAQSTMESTDRLLAQLRRIRDAPVSEIDEAGVRIRESRAVWAARLTGPKCPRRIYLKRLFATRDRIFDAFKALHRKYVKLGAGRKRSKRRFGSEQRTIFRQIDRLRETRGMSTIAAINML